MTEGQHELLSDAEKEMGIGPVEMARQLNTSWSTYSKWRNETRPMPGVALRCLELLLLCKNINETLGELE